MSVIVYAVPATVEPPAGVVQGWTMKWVGWDGSEWDLTDPTSSVRMTDEGIVGLSWAPAERYTSQSPARPGSRYRGFRTLERPVSWPVDVYSDADVSTWFARDRAFAKTLRRDRTGEWTVTQVASGETRTLVCRFADDGDATFTNDPGLVGWQSYRLALVAEDPYWRGRPIRRTFAGATSDPFIPEGGGPPFTISESSNLSSASIDNPGDVDAWPVVTIEGPTTDVTFGVDGREIGIPGDLDGDDVLVIDTHPDRQSATLNGVRVRGVLAPHEFAPIPAGGVSALDISITGAGTVTCEIIPRFERAW